MASFAVLLTGCGINTPTYFEPEMALEVGGEGQMGPAIATVDIPFRTPSEVDRRNLEKASRTAGHRVPWLQRDQVSVSMQYSITNLSDQAATVQLLINGANEFWSYDAAAIAAALAMQSVDNDAPIVLSLIQGTPVVIAPRETLTGTVREDDFAEAALDLDAFSRWQAVALSVLINKSEVNPIGLEMVPKDLDVPQFFRIIATLSSSQPARLEFLVRVRDDKGVLAGDGDEIFKPTPMMYMPMGAMMPGNQMMMMPAPMM